MEMENLITKKRNQLLKAFIDQGEENDPTLLKDFYKREEEKP